MRTSDIVYRYIRPNEAARYLRMTGHVYKWAVWHDGDEEENHSGWGATPQEALADLERLDQERAEALEDAEHIEDE